MIYIEEGSVPYMAPLIGPWRCPIESAAEPRGLDVTTLFDIQTVSLRSKLVKRGSKIGTGADHSNHENRRRRSALYILHEPR